MSKRCRLNSHATRRDAIAMLGLLTAAPLAGTFTVPASAQTSGQPIRVGSSLSLTGPLGAVALIHKMAGEIYVERLNKQGGLLGRPVEWVILDDQSKPDLARTLYERLITVDKVDFLVGPYGTSNILSAMAVAERHGKVLIHNTFGLPKLAKYDMQFPVYSIGMSPEETYPSLVFDALAASNKPPKTIAIVTNKFPSTHLWSTGARAIAKKRGLTEVLYLEYELGNRDFGPIAARIREANPDFLWAGSLGLEPNMMLEALGKLNYKLKSHLQLFAAVGPLAASPDGQYAMSAATFEPHPPFTNDPEAADFVRTYRERAKQANLSYIDPELQAGLGYALWQTVNAAITGAKSLDDKAVAQWLRTNKVKTIGGTLRFDGPNNTGDDLGRLKQVQDGKWVIVWPQEFAPPGVKLVIP
jgi:branched-chain amino acid transport system substrate-binding protein